MLNPVQLRTLSVVVRTASFAAAAQELGYTASAVSQQMAALERTTHLRLFERRARSIAATPAALTLAERSAEPLALLDALSDDVQALAGGRLGTLRLGSFPTASARLLPAALAKLSTSFSDVSIQIEEGEPDLLIPQVADREIDLAMVFEYDLVPRVWPRGLRRHHLRSERLVLLIPEARLPQFGLPNLEQLSEETWISTARGTSGAHCLERRCAQAGFVPRVAFRTNDYDVVARFVREGLGIAQVPEDVIADDAGVARAPLAGRELHRHTIAVHRRVAYSPLVTPALNALTAVAATMAKNYLP